MHHIYAIILSSWQILLDASAFIILGLLFAALIRAFISSESIVRYMGGRNIKSVLLAALFGVPLPLCSCGVVPTAMALRKQGASRAATVSFLITTPESSIDSIAITYALIDPLMTVFRPLAAFVTGFVAGVGEIVFGEKGNVNKPEEFVCPHCEAPSPFPSPSPARQRCSGGRGEGEGGGDHRVNHSHTLRERLASGMHFAFIDLLTDISRWFLIGILIAGLISYAIPASFIENYLGEGWLSMFIMLAVGLPLYVCATASTPIAAALILKGMSPGAALVFLLAGPATNAASLIVIAKMLGKKTAAIYIISIAVCAVLLGMALNEIYHLMEIDIRAVAGHAHEMMPVWIKWATAVPLTGVMIIASLKLKFQTSNDK